MCSSPESNLSASDEPVQRRESSPRHRIVSVFPHNGRTRNNLISLPRRETQYGDRYRVTSCRQNLSKFNFQRRVTQVVCDSLNDGPRDQPHAGRCGSTAMADKLFVSDAELDFDVGGVTSNVGRQSSKCDPRR